MENRIRRKMWQKPWGYSESITVVVGVLVIGLILQLTIGSFDFYLLAKPANFIVGLIIIALCVVVGVTRKSSFTIWFSGVPMSVSISFALLLLTIVMGLTPQTPNGVEGRSILALDAMTSNWSFILIYLLTLLSLGSLIVRRLCVFHISSYPFFLNHIGLWLLLAASGLGYADMERYIMYVQEGQTEWRVYDDDKNVKELPIAIELNDFDMDVYPPKLAIIDRATGEVQPFGEPHYFQIDTDVLYGNLNEWNVEVKDYIHNAIRSSDSTYREVYMPGATPAVNIRLTNGGEVHEGWVCGGNKAQLYMTLNLNDKYSVVMTEPEPRSFSSSVGVYTQSGGNKHAVVEVNNPLSLGYWTVYQYGYDNSAGKMSSYSSFELVYDPWSIGVYVGVILMMLGSACMLWTGSKKREAVYDVE